MSGMDWKAHLRAATLFVLQGQTAPLAQLALGRPAPTAPLYFTAVVPINVTFPSTVRIAIDEHDAQPTALEWTRCLPSGCFASVALTDDALARWRARTKGGRLIFRNGAGQDTVVPMSFNGFGRAVEAGATVLMPVADQFWGDRYGILKDPYGHRWSIASRIEDLSPRALQQRAADWTKEQQQS